MMLDASPQAPEQLIASPPEPDVEEEDPPTRLAPVVDIEGSRIDGQGCHASISGSRGADDLGVLVLVLLRRRKRGAS